MACASQHQRGLKRVPRFPCTWGKSPGELPDWKRVGPAKAAEMLGPAITQEADAGLHARGFAPRTTAAVPGMEPDSGVAVRVTRPCARALLRGPPSIKE